MTDELEKRMNLRNIPANAETAKPLIANKLRLRHDRIVARASTVPTAIIDKRIAEGRKLRAMFAATNWGTVQLHCHKTGRPLNKLTTDDFERLVVAHGEERARDLLALTRTSQTATEWLATDSTALRALCKVDPIGYFIYTAGLIYSPASFANSGTMTKLASIYTNSSTPSTDHETAVKLASLEDRAQAWLQLHTIPLESIIELNELMRRVFSLINPLELLRNYQFRDGKSLATHTKSPDDLAAFRAKLVSVLAHLASKRIGERITKTDIRYVSYAELCDIQQKHKGLAQFRLQESRTAKTSVDPEIMLALRDFVAESILDLRDGEPSNAVAPVKRRTLVDGVAPVINTTGKLDLRFDAEVAKPKSNLLAMLKGGKSQ